MLLWMQLLESCIFRWFCLFFEAEEKLPVPMMRRHGGLLLSFFRFSSIFNLIVFCMVNCKFFLHILGKEQTLISKFNGIHNGPIIFDRLITPQKNKWSITESVSGIRTVFPQYKHETGTKMISPNLVSMSSLRKSAKSNMKEEKMNSFIPFLDAGVNKDSISYASKKKMPALESNLPISAILSARSAANYVAALSSLGLSGIPNVNEIGNVYIT